MSGMLKANKQKSRAKTQKEAVQVFCRIRPLVSPSEPLCLRVIPPCHVLMTPSSALRNGSDIRFTFKNVFNEKTSQKTIFDSIALPSVENVLLGRNALLFAYGVTGSGKTYTMTGSPQDVGVIPRSLDVIFNSISNNQAKKYIFKPDRLNSFDIQSEQDAEIDRHQELMLKASKKSEKKLSAEMAARMRENTVVRGIDEDNLYSVFITYVEIYNNTVYDLLEDVDDEALHVKPLQPRLIREDSNHHMFVHGVNEIEVTNADDAFELYLKGKKRRRIGHTNLNSESSRSHSIFTIRIVQAPLNEYGSEVYNDKSSLIVSQLSLVDLAGSERTHRTKNTGQRLREACNINNSLLTLRTCLELLRENQKGAKKMIPYRDSRLTHLFKTFLDGDGQISMIICVGPHIDDYDEILHVMKFAEISQEVQVAVSTPVKTTHYTPGRRKAYQIARESENNKNNANLLEDENYSSYWFNNLPDARFIDDDTIPKLMRSLEDGMISVSHLSKKINDGISDCKRRLTNAHREIGSALEELTALRSRCLQEKEKIESLENKALSNDSQMLKMKRKIDDYEVNVKKLKRELTEKEMVISETRMEKEKAKKAFAQKMVAAQEKLNRDLEKKLRSQKSALQYEMRHKESKLNAVKKIIACDDMLDSSGQFLKPMPLAPSSSQESLSSAPKSPWGTPRSQKVTTPSTPSTQGTPRGRPTARKMGVAVANRRFRRSKSAGDDLWLEHRAGVHAPSNTIMQPTMTKRKSITKLDAKDVTENASKYCLMTQGQDSDGDIETRLYKGDIIPTAGGGAQVMFNDVEVLRQMSPTSSPPCKTPKEIRQHFEAACSSSKKVYLKSPRL